MTTTTVLLGIVLLQWLAVVAISFVKRMPKALLASTGILAVGYVNAFGVSRDRLKPVSTAGVGTGFSLSLQGNCALVDPGMTADTVRTKLGAPPETRDDGKTRGPGAVTWIYRDSRCAVHLLDDKVELVE